MGDEPGSSVFIARANLTARQEPRPTHLVERCDLSLLPFLSSTRRSRLPSRLVKHHLPLLLGSIVCIWALYVTRPYTDVLSRASFATGYPALVLLGATLLIGPLNLLRHRPNPVSIDLRRDLGIWAGILAIVHTAIGQCVHLRGRPWLYYVYGACGALSRSGCAPRPVWLCKLYRGFRDADRCRSLRNLKRLLVAGPGYAAMETTPALELCRRGPRGYARLWLPGD